MSIYFDFKTINELTGYNNYRQPKEFTLEELAQYDGKKGRPSYVAVEGVVYDVSNLETWEEGEHYGLTAGQDLSDQFYSCHGIVRILQNAPKVGTLMDSEYMDDMNDMDNTNGMNNYSNKTMNRQVGQTDTSKFTPDDWIRYITPVVTYALREPSQGMNAQRLYQKFILMGVLVGLGRSPQDAINQVQQWQNTGASQLLKAGTTAGTTGTGTTGGLGTGGMGTGTGTGTTGGLGTGGMGTGTGTGTTGGLGTGGMGTGTGTGTTGGLGTGGMGTGTGTGTTGGLGTGGMGTGTGTTGGLGTGGMGTGTGTGTMGSGGAGTGGMGTGTGTGTMGSGGAGTGGMGTGTGTMGSGGAGTGAGTGTGGSTGSMGTRNRLFFD